MHLFNLLIDASSREYKKKYYSCKGFYTIFEIGY